MEGSKRGGTRAGAGRKKLDDTIIEARVSLNLDADAINVFIKLGDGNMSLGARLCAKAYLQRDLQPIAKEPEPGKPIRGSGASAARAVPKQIKRNL